MSLPTQHPSQSPRLASTHKIKKGLYNDLHGALGSQVLQAFGLAPCSVRYRQRQLCCKLQTQRKFANLEVGLLCQLAFEPLVRARSIFQGYILQVLTLRRVQDWAVFHSVRACCAVYLWRTVSVSWSLFSWVMGGGGEWEAGFSSAQLVVGQYMKLSETKRFFTIRRLKRTLGIWGTECGCERERQAWHFGIFEAAPFLVFPTPHNFE